MEHIKLQPFALALKIFEGWPLQELALDMAEGGSACETVISEIEREDIVAATELFGTLLNLYDIDKGVEARTKIIAAILIAADAKLFETMTLYNWSK